MRKNAVDKTASGPAAGKSFTSSLLALAASGITLKLVGVIYAFAKPKFLSPSDLGLWNLLSLVPKYGSYLHLGAREGMLYRIPRLFGEDEKNPEIAEIMRSVYWFSLILQGSLAVALIGAAVLLPLEVTIRYGLAATGAYVLVSWYSAYQLTVLKAYQRFDVISKAHMIDAVTLLIVCVPLVALFGIYGVFFGAILSSLLPTGYIAFRNPLRLKIRVDKKLLWKLIRAGFPMMAYNFLLVILSTSDRMVIGLALDRESVGYYAVALTLTGIILQIPMSVRDMLEPKLMSDMALENRTRVWANHFRDPILRTAFMFPIIWGPIAFFGDLALGQFLPNYIDSFTSVVILSHGVVFLALITVIRGTIVAYRLEILALAPIGFGIAFNWTINLFLINHGADIAGVAFGSSVSFALVFFFLFGMIASRSGADRRNILVVCLFTSVPVLFSITSILIINEVLTGVMESAIVGAGIKLLIYTLAAIAVMAPAESSIPGFKGPISIGLDLWRHYGAGRSK